MTLTPGETAVEQVSKEQLQAISDERLAQLITVERGRSALYVETAIQGQTLTLVEDRLSALPELQSLRALQSPDREGVTLDRDSIRFARQFADAYRSGAQGATMDCDAAQTLALSIDDILSALSPHPETSKEVGETEAVAWQWSDFSGDWYTVDTARMGIVEQEELAKLVAAKHEGRARPLYAHPAPQSPPAPVVDEGMWEVEAYDADDNFAFGASGSLEDVRREIAHYAAVYNEPLRFERIQRSTVTFAALEGRS